MYWDFEPLVVYGITVTNPNREVCQGSIMKYDIDFDKRMEASCTVKRALVNDYLVNYEPVHPPRKALGRQIAKGDLFVPKIAETHPWMMRWTAECEVGPYKRIIAVTKESCKFHVVDCSGSNKGPKGEPGPAGKNFWGK
jgi:hypothetical protein